MVDQLHDATPEGTQAAPEQPVDPPRQVSKARQKKDDERKRWWAHGFEVPTEKRTTAGTLVFRTHDQQTYARLEDGSIRRTTKKVHGKAAKRARRAARP